VSALLCIAVGPLSATDIIPYQMSLLQQPRDEIGCGNSALPDQVVVVCGGCRATVSRAGGRMLAVIYVLGICVYVFGICVVATMLFAAVNAIEPNRRYASVLKFLIVFVSVAAIAGRLMRSSADGLSALMP
jgi:hypothetical protein